MVAAREYRGRRGAEGGKGKGGRWENGREAGEIYRGNHATMLNASQLRSLRNPGMQGMGGRRCLSPLPPLY